MKHNPFSGFLKRMRRNYDDFGLFVTVSKSIGIILSPLFAYRVYWLYRIDLNKSATKEYPHSPFNTRLISEKEIDVIKQIEDMEEWLSGHVKNKITNGALCLVAFYENKVAGFNLVERSMIDLPVVHYSRPLRKNECFSTQITVKKSFRGKGLGSLLRGNIFRELKNNGFKVLYGGTNISNRANIRLSEKVGFRMIAKVHYLKILFFQSTFLRRVHS